MRQRHTTKGTFMSAVLLDPIARAKTANNRYNIYAVVHKGLRGFMMDILVKVGPMDVMDTAEAAQVVDQLRAMLAFCDRHIEHENQYLRPAIERSVACAAVPIADDHVGHQLEIAELSHAVDELVTAP